MLIPGSLQELKFKAVAPEGQQSSKLVCGNNPEIEDACLPRDHTEMLLQSFENAADGRRGFRQQLSFGAKFCNLSFVYILPTRGQTPTQCEGLHWAVPIDFACPPPSIKRPRTINLNLEYKEG
jgi:hypothetical protein